MPSPVSARVSTDSRKPLSPEAVLRPTPRLTNPHWGGEGEDSADHGDELEMVIEARGIEDGQKVRFVVQNLHGGQWQSYAEVEATVQSERATGKLVLKHPDAGDDSEDLDKSHFRFRCVLA